MSTLRDVQYIGGGGGGVTMRHSGDIMSTLGDAQCIKGIS